MGEGLAALAGARVLVTGGCGLIGSRIGRALSRYGAHAIALDTMDAYPFDYAEAFGAADAYREVVRGDVADLTTVRAVARGTDYVIHAAAYADVAACSSNVGESTRTNVLGTQAVLGAVTEARPSRFVYVSSASVYGNGPRPGTRQRWSEDTSTEPISVYANAKLWGESQTRLQLTAAGVEHVGLRYFSVYGEPQVPKPNSHSWCVAWFGMYAALGLPLPLNHAGRQIRDFIHVDDVAEATVRALVAPDIAGRVVNVGTGVGTPVADIASLVAAEFPGVRTVVSPGSADDPMGGFADTTLMHRLLRFTPTVPLEDGVRRYLRWLSGSDLLRTFAPLLTGAPVAEGRAS
jgi:nucleoside-diphosphate-sugar epimerase